MDNISLFFQIFNLSGQSHSLDQFMIFGTKYLVYIMFILTLILAWFGKIKERKTLLLIILGLPISILIIIGIHQFYFEPRPFVTFNFLPVVSEAADSASFPSRHATIASVIAFAYTYFKSKWALVFWLAMLWIGLSRVFVGVHYPLDILGGFATAAVALSIALQIKKLIISRIYPHL